MYCSLILRRQVFLRNLHPRDIPQVTFSTKIFFLKATYFVSKFLLDLRVAMIERKREFIQNKAYDRLP